MGSEGLSAALQLPTASALRQLAEQKRSCWGLIHIMPTEESSTPPTIMVVEPDVIVRMVIADYLRQCGYKVIEGRDAEDVLAILNADLKVGTIFAEVALPGPIDGFSLAKRIRETRPEIDVLLTSGIRASADKAADLCDEGPLQKPYTPEEVLRRINILREQRKRSLQF